MDIAHVTSRVAQFGSIDDVFRRLADDAQYSRTGRGTLALLALLRSDISGPKLWAYECHHHLILLAEDSVADGGGLLDVHAFGENSFRISFGLPLGVTGIPRRWDPSVNLQVFSQLHATLMVALGLRTAISNMGLDLPAPKYVNHNGPAAPKVDLGDEVKCPFCDAWFDVNDSASWNGQMHLLCGQPIAREPRAT